MIYIIIKTIFANIYIDDAASGIEEFLKDVETYMIG